MAKKLSVQTVAATAKTLKKVAPSLSANEERALRMRIGVGLAPSANAARAEELAKPRDVRGQQARADRAHGLPQHGSQNLRSAPAVTEKDVPPALAGQCSSSRKDKIIKALRRSALGAKRSQPPRD